MPGPGLTSPGVAPKRSTLVIPIDPGDYLSLALLAQVDGRSIAGYVRQALKRHLAEAAQ